MGFVRLVRTAKEANEASSQRNNFSQISFHTQPQGPDYRRDNVLEALVKDPSNGSVEEVVLKGERGLTNHKGIRYTTDGGDRENLEKGTIRGDAVFSTVDFTTGSNPWPIFKLQKEFNAPGKSPPLCSEFYTGWLTQWGEKNAKTDADFTASALEQILSRNGSAVLYVCPLVQTFSCC
ncbi:hypothetical protein OIU84_004739 [Salix udensis]|uniref:beta-galactosidase n=1 Tax=Salix udensis TaxID=889485 RepID=A0AAD6K2Z0_9ROSI|nr:hypothetical protein OIU84_004739 [Salix udensis]